MDIILPIPSSIGSGSSGGAQYVRTREAYDVAIGGVPFFLKIDDERPYVRALPERRKQQFDNQAQPGEQSLQDWWLRSQADYRGGAGIIYQDPDTANQFADRFADSLGVNISDAGDVKLTYQLVWQPNIVFGSQRVFIRAYVNGSGAPRYWAAGDNKLLSESGTPTPTTITWGGTGTITGLTSSGNRYIVCDSTGIWSGVDTGAGASLYTVAGDNVIEFVKGRLMLGNNNKLYELTLAGGALPGSPLFTHQNPNWRWTAFDEAPNAIYAAGDDGTTGAIYKLAIDDTGAIPVLTGATVIATLPRGEYARDIFSYVGTYVGISTNRGFRVAEIAGNGDLAYGPLLFEPDDGCYGITGYDRFMIVGSVAAHDSGASGVYKVDLGQRITEQTGAIRYAYSRDAYIEDLGFAGNEIWSVDIRYRDDYPFIIAGQSFVGVFEQGGNVTPPKLHTRGYLNTGRIRYNTQEPKLYKFFSIRGQVDEGSLAVSLIDAGGGETSYITYTQANPPGNADIAITSLAEAQNYVSLKFTFSSNGTTHIKGPVLNAWQMKALPGSIRQREFTFTVLCFDREEDKTGQWIGYPGRAKERIDAIEQMAQEGNSVLFQDLYREISAQVTFEQAQFVQMAPPGREKRGFGGYYTFKLRTVSDTVM